jgi:MoaA/NifB/PqqE/SkfB family radical SAM enzyme
MCDIWKANAERRDIPLHQIDNILTDLDTLGVRLVTITGGEALMGKNLWHLLEGLHEREITISLMSTGILLEKHAHAIAQYCDAVTVSLDGDRETHNAIRLIPHAFERLSAGINALRIHAPNITIVARCVIQQANYMKIPYIIHAARGINADFVSFLPADVYSQAFNRPNPWDTSRVQEIALSPVQVTELKSIIDKVIKRYRTLFTSGFIYETPEALLRIVQYYDALNGRAKFPSIKCNAPWVSAVVEPNLDVKPCYFHPSIGNLNDGSLSEIINSQNAREFRQNLDIEKDPVCSRCVCPMNISLANA